MQILLAQMAGPSASTIFYLTLLIIFLTAIVTTVVTKWSRDKCLKFFHHYHVTLERPRGHTIWGKLKVFPTGIEIVYDHAFVDPHGRKKTSFMVYQGEVDQQILGLFRYHDEMPVEDQKRRLGQIHRMFNPGPMRRVWRGVRNFINTLRDAFNAAIGAAVGQYQKMNPSSAVLATQGSNVTAIGQTLLGKLANAYEPMLEQYIGQPVIVDVADPLDPNNKTVEFSGFLADYTSAFIAIFNVDHGGAEEAMIDLPESAGGDPLPLLGPPPAPGAPGMILPTPLSTQQQIDIRVDGVRLQLRNRRQDPVMVLQLIRAGFEPVPLGLVIPPNGTFEIPARDARGGKLKIAVVRSLDLVVPRKSATIRHAGELVEKRGLADELHLSQLPLVPTLLGLVSEREPEDQRPADAAGTSAEDD
jgi:hypothetical protein